MMISKATSDTIRSTLYHLIASCIIVGGMACITAASCQQAPKPTGISVQQGPEGGVETCVTWATRQGCSCPGVDAGPGK